MLTTSLHVGEQMSLSSDSSEEDSHYKIKHSVKPYSVPKQHFLQFSLDGAFSLFPWDFVLLTQLFGVSFSPPVKWKE